MRKKRKQLMEYSKLLNPTQLAAVEYNDGPAVIVAGAGSGKTRVLTYKIAYLLDMGVLPENILALTFTNKAAREMQERIVPVVGPQKVKRLWMGTFHSIFLRILRYEVDRIAYKPNFSVYDTADSKSLIKSIVKELNLDSKIYKSSKIYSRISSMKNYLVTPAMYEESREWRSYDASAQMEEMANIYAIYCRRCREANAMDFDDILVYTHTLFANCEDVLAKYQARFHHILVDEYQDTNTVQHGIVTRLAAQHARISVVGDDAQSIYSFRGAQIDNMLRFNDTFKACKLFKLEENYRSTQNIVNAANSLIAKNKNQIKKKVYSNRSVGEKIAVVEAYSDYDEATQVATGVQMNVQRGGYEYKDVAVLYRTNAQSRVVEESLRRLAIPYKIYGGLSFYQRKEIKDILSYLRLLINRQDVEAMKRVINYPTRGIGDTTVKKLLEHLSATSLPLFDILKNPLETGLNVNKGTAGKLMGFSNIIDDITEVYATSDAYTTVEIALRMSGIMADVSSSNDPDDLARKENLEEFLSAVKEFCDKRMEEEGEEVRLEDFLSEVSLLTDADNEEGDKLNSVTLMTVHASKGLEFGLVYVVGMEEDLFPSMRVENVKDLEEERRLFYVAITRAKERCCVSYAQSRFIHGKSEFRTPSRFLSDIDEKYIDIPKAKIHKDSGSVIDPYGIGVGTKEMSFGRMQPSTRKYEFGSALASAPKTEVQVPPRANMKKVSPSQGSGEMPQGCNIKQGDRVAHQVFGMGDVVHIEVAGENTKAKIIFDNHGEKQLLLKYARLTII